MDTPENYNFDQFQFGWKVGLVIAYIIILVTGLASNSMVIIAMIKQPKLRIKRNIFFVNLAIADLLVMIVCVPGTIISILVSAWSHGITMCKTMIYVQGVSICSSAYFLVLISFDRFVEICYSLTKPRGLSLIQSRFSIACAWMVSLLLALPRMFHTTMIESGGEILCAEKWEGNDWQIYFVVVELFCFYIFPIILIVTTSIFTWRSVYKSEIANISEVRIVANESIIDRERKVRHSLSTLILIFLLSWLPYHVVMTVYTFCEIRQNLESAMGVALMLVQWLGFCNSSINPFIYAFPNKDFQKEIVSLLKKLLPLANKPNNIYHL